MHASASARRYQEVSVKTSTRGQLLLALYDTAIRNAKMAALSIRSSDVVAKGRQIQRVSDIVAELASTLDHSVAPELCQTLEQLYFYMQDRLAHANAALDPSAAEEVASLLTTLREAWGQAVAQVEGGGGK